MKQAKEFQIPHFGLAPGLHQFNYFLEDSFFEQIAKTDFKNAQLNVDLELDKKTSLFLLKFTVSGTVTIPCDRCGDDFEMKIWDEFELVGKLADAEKVDKLNEDDLEVIYFSRAENTIDISHLLYEEVMLSFPIQINHPEDENGDYTCNKAALSLLSQLEEEEITNKEEINNNNSNSLQEQLKKLKKK